MDVTKQLYKVKEKVILKLQATLKQKFVLHVLVEFHVRECKIRDMQTNLWWQTAEQLLSEHKDDRGIHTCKGTWGNFR